MRYLGNKETIVSEIFELLSNVGLVNQNLTFFDAFCGSGSVADSLKDNFQTIIINDNLTWSVTYSYGRLCAKSCDFKLLGFDPFDYLNQSDKRINGFMYNNYSTGNSNRMYFTPDNAGRIDFFRRQIDEWKNDNLLSSNEYSYLLACLIESVSDVSNTAGVYGAFLKKWDSRALKPIRFDKVDSKNVYCNSIKTYNSKIEDIIGYVECDVLYLDPPYTQNQYGTQYHLLETLILDDSPSISKVTGSRSTAPMRSDWSKQYKCNILFDKILAKTQAKYVLFSYNNDGFMSKDFIEASMKRYGEPETYICKKIVYKKYQNWKSNNNDEHFEYLFFIKLKNKHDVYYESPLNYIGSKAKISKDIIERIPRNTTKFVDAFGGGFNVGINAQTNSVTYNDINHFVKDLVESFRIHDTYQYLMYIKKITQKFGLEKANAEAYVNARAYYNSFSENNRDSRLLYTIILYGYQQQIRFNGSHEFNNPVGVRWFNDKVLEKMISFSRVIKEHSFVFISKNYLSLIPIIDENTFVYLDPPYMLTTGAYNDGKRGFKGWNDELEQELFNFADNLTLSKVRFMLSYVIEHKGKKNDRLIDWVKRNNYRIIELGDILGISGSRRKEVLIINYELYD